MGICRYCGQDAGFFRKQHDDCHWKHENSFSKMVCLAVSAAKDSSALLLLEQQLSNIESAALPVRINRHQALICGWEQAVNDSLNDNVLSSIEEYHLMVYAHKFGLSQSDLNKNLAFTRFVYGCALRDVLEKGYTSRAVITFQLPFNFQKNESLVWCFRNVSLYEEKVYKSYVGRNQGISIKVMKGVYYRVGNFKGYPIETSRNEQVDIGILGVTTQHIYFAGSKKSFRIPYKKIVSVSPYSDGIGICRDVANAKSQTFITGEGWFIYNIVMNLSHNV